MNDNYPKGSEWRKWDLQIHVPEAKHANQYPTESGVDLWGRFIEYIKYSGVSVFGITDYYSVAGYVTFKKKDKGHRRIKKQKVFPLC